ncbi:hypothetical protein F441_20307 [Phytophthora nicotianae CJ01A1]|uniref:Uncharacterized protein n=1 Tax=Phytophthora nicotianae CJ01A1 TaxID=1317063 RepID=W2VWK1_PHYNI|nr:hypothetical protein F441_20307 [Phytophthora nicotianae CJ01A1]
MFEATQTLLRKRTPLTSLYDSTDKFMLNKKQTSYKIKKRFQEQFADPSQLSVTPDRTSRPLRRQSPQTNCNSPSSVFGMDAQSDPTQYQQNF